MAKVGIFQGGIYKSGTANIGPAEIGPGEVGFVKGVAAQNSAPKVSLSGIVEAGDFRGAEGFAVVLALAQGECSGVGCP